MVTAMVLLMSLSIRAQAEVDYYEQKRAPVGGVAHLTHDEGGNKYQLTFKKAVRPLTRPLNRETTLWQVDAHLYLTSPKGIDEITSITIQPNRQGTAGVRLSLLQFDLSPPVDGQQRLMLNRKAARVLKATLAQDTSRSRDTLVTLNGMHGATHAELKYDPTQIMLLMREIAPSEPRRACRQILGARALTRLNRRRLFASY